MAHIKVIRRSMRPEEWIELRFGWLKRHIYKEKLEIDTFRIREARQVSEMIDKYLNIMRDKYGIRGRDLMDVDNCDHDDADF